MPEPKDKCWADFTIKPWSPLTEAPAGFSADKVPVPAKTPPKKSRNNPPTPGPGSPASYANLVGMDILTFRYATVKSRIKRLRISVRAFETAKRILAEKDLILEYSAGKSLYLIPTPKFFTEYSLPCPYRRAVSLPHAFFCGWHQFWLRHDPCFRRITLEMPIGTQGATADLGIRCQDGSLQAVEVILSTSNVIQTAAKYLQTAYQRVWFSCRDYALKDTVKRIVQKSELPPTLTAKLEYLQFSTIATRYRKFLPRSENV